MKRCSITLSHAIWQESKWYLINQQSINLASVYQAKYSGFLKRKQHFLRLGIRGLVVRLQQESTWELHKINNRLDNQISAVQSNSKSRSNLAHEKILFIGIWGFRMSKQSSFHWIRSGRKAEFGQSSLCSTARWHRQGWDPPKAVGNWAPGFSPHPGSAKAEGLDWLPSSQLSPFLLLWVQMCVQRWVQGLLSASCVRQTGNWRQFLQHLSWNAKPQPKDYSCTVFWWALPPQLWQIDFSWVFILCI